MVRPFLLTGLLAFAASLQADVRADYVKAPKTLYVWNSSTTKPTPRDSNHHGVYTNENGSADRLAGFVKLHGFTRVYFFVGAIEWEWESVFKDHEFRDADKLASTIGKLRKSGADVHAMWYLNDTPDNLDNYKHALDLLETVHGYNKKYPDAKLSGLHCDQEPAKPEAWGDLKAMFELLATRNDELKADLTLGASLKPQWLRESWDGRKYFEHLVDVLDETTLMAYNNNPATVKPLATPLLEYASRAGKRAEVAIETGRYNAAPEETYADLIEREPETFFQIVADLAAAFSKQKSFERLVIHSWSQYFFALHGLDPDVSDLEVESLSGPLRSDVALPEAAMPDGAMGFSGKVTGKVTRLGRTAFAFEITKVERTAANSSAKNADALKGSVVIVRAGTDDAHGKWIMTLTLGQEETIEVSADGDAMQLAALSSSQKKAARKVD